MNPKQDTLIDKLEELVRVDAAVMEQLNDPAVGRNPAKLVSLSREHAQLSRIVEPYLHYRQLLAQQEQAQAILDDPASEADMRAMAREELDDLAGQGRDALERIKELLVMSDDEQIDSVMLELRAGTGGEEAALFCGDLLDIYRRYSEKHGWKFEIMSASPTDMGGFREVIVNVKGEGVWTHLGYEGGGHRVQRVPKTESQGRIHTSAATVAVLPEREDIEINIDWDKDVLEYTSRAGGPGGQNVNKVESAIKLEHIETGITVSMRDEKSQHKNRAKARRIMAIRLADHFRSKQMAAEAQARKTMIGSGDRSQRIRTYNYPQNRCTDHRLKGEGAEGANYNLDRMLAGDLDDLVNALIAHDKAQRLANL